MDWGPFRSSRRVLLVVFIAQALFAITPSSAPAAEVCWKVLVNDYWADGRVDRAYSVKCFRDALDKLPPDVSQYSDAQDDLRRALAGAVRDRYDRSDEPPNAATPRLATPDERAPKGFFEEALDRLAPKTADAVPVQVFVLGALALLLIGSAGVSRLNEYVQARRGAAQGPTD